MLTGADFPEYVENFIQEACSHPERMLGRREKLRNEKKQEPMGGGTKNNETEDVPSLYTNTTR